MKITLASGYFNCIDDYINRIFNKGTYYLDVLSASPKVCLAGKFIIISFAYFRLMASLELTVPRDIFLLCILG